MTSLFGRTSHKFNDISFDTGSGSQGFAMSRNGQIHSYKPMIGTGQLVNCQSLFVRDRDIENSIGESMFSKQILLN